MLHHLEHIKFQSLTGLSRPLRIFASGAALVLLCLLPACGADSPLVHIFGKDIENFVDKTVDQKEPAKLNGEYLFLYLQKPDHFVERGSSEDKVRLCLKNSAAGQVKTVFHGNLANRIEYGFIDSGRSRVLFTIKNWGGSQDRNTYLYVYDYEKNLIFQNRIPVLEPKKYTNQPVGADGVFLDGIDLCENNTSVCTRIQYGQNEKGSYRWDFNLIDIKTGIRKTIDEETYRRLATESHLNSGVRYESIKHGKKIELFSVYQYHDRIKENPKPKYNGIYINDGKNNIRISRLDGYELLKSKPIWIEDDKKVIMGRYLVDIEGRQKAVTIINGQMLYAVQVRPTR